MTESLPEVNWVPVPGFPDYSISDYGQVYSLKSKKILDSERGQ